MYIHPFPAILFVGHVCHTSCLYCNYCVFSLLFPPIQEGDVPLGVAAENGHSQTVQRLMEAGAIINHQNKVMVTWCCMAHVHTLWNVYCMIVGNDDWHNNYVLFILCKSHIMMSQFLIPTACFFTSVMQTVIYIMMAAS